MSQRLRAFLCFLGFFAVLGIVMSDRFQVLRDAIPESIYYYGFVAILAAMTVLGLYAWWQHYNGRKIDPAAGRLKKWFESPTWWNWPF